MFVVETYNDGVKLESSVNSTTQSGLLDLNLITVSADGKTKVSIKTSEGKDFDEIRLAIYDSPIRRRESHQGADRE